MLGPLRGYAAGQGPHRALKARTNCPVCSRDKVGGKKFHGRMIAQNSKVYTLLWTALFQYRPWLCVCRRADALPGGSYLLPPPDSALMSSTEPVLMTRKSASKTAVKIREVLGSPRYRQS